MHVNSPVTLRTSRLAKIFRHLLCAAFQRHDNLLYHSDVIKVSSCATGLLHDAPVALDSRRKQLRSRGRG